jgi:hypothetical protein
LIPTPLVADSKALIGHKIGTDIGGSEPDSALQEQQLAEAVAAGIDQEKTRVQLPKL